MGNHCREAARESCGTFTMRCGDAEGATAPGISQATGPRDLGQSGKRQRKQAAEGAKLSGTATDGGDESKPFEGGGRRLTFGAE